MKKSLLFAIILLLISPLDVNANPFEKAFKELEKGLEDLADELEGNDKNKKDSKDLTNGPAKLTQAMEITKEHYGVDLTKSSKLYITEGIKAKKIVSSPRIGIKQATDKLWNFKINI